MTRCLVSIALLLNPSPISAPKEAPVWPTTSMSDSSVSASTAEDFSTLESWSFPTLDLSQVSAATPATTTTPLIDTTPPSLSDAQLYRLRMCESTDRYWIDTGNGYYGAYQFDLRTWNGVAERHLPWLVGVRPNNAWPAEQDAMTRWLWSERGRQPWPVCGYRVGAP